MAIIVSLAKEQEKMILGIMVLMSFIIALAITFFIFPLGGKEYLSATRNNNQIMVLDNSIFQSEEIKNLELFSVGEQEFYYEAVDEEGEKISGSLFTMDEAGAKDLLLSMGFSEIIITGQDAVNVRDNPFAPYN